MSGNDNYDNKRNGLIISFVLVFVLMMVLSISPLLGYYLPLVILLIPGMKSKSVRIILILISLLGLAFVVTSRNIYTADGSDFDMYYTVYQNISNGSTIFVNEFSSGIEFFLPLIFKILSFFSTNITEEQLLFIMMFSQLALIYIWLECYGTQGLRHSEKTLCIVSTIGILSAFSFSQVLRQSIATIICLYAITMFFNKKYKIFLCLYLLAIISHLSSLILLPLYLIFLKKNKLSYVVLVLIFLFSLSFTVLINYFLSYNLLGAATYKLGYYTITDARGWDLSTYFKFLVLTFIFSISHFHPQRGELKFFFWGTAAIYLVLLPIPLASDRFLMLISVVLPGYLLFYSAFRIQFLLRIFLVLLFIFKVITLGVSYIPGPPLNYWYAYPWVGGYPFYYLI
ncbi:TPA: EpsG family protein [Klebsiella pneumoniae]|nr:EpsG family protein [Klebsiella pneumoniae]